MILSTGLKDAWLTNGSLRDTINNGELRLYSGTAPVDADAALGGATLLITYTAAGAGSFNLTFEATASSGSLSKTAAQTWEGSSIPAGGTPTFFRYVLNGEDDLASTTRVRIQGSVGGAGADMYLANTLLTGSTTYYVDAFALAIPNLP